MTYEEYYKDSYMALKATETSLCRAAENIKSEDYGFDLQPVVYYCSRIKRPDSMVRKLTERGFGTDLNSALNNVYDAVGIRIICSFASDIMPVTEKLQNDPDIEIIEKVDYLSHPKPNGYRSVHLRVRVKSTNTLAEIQLRTIAMDFWATLEHQLKYKKSIKGESLIKSELKRCADEIASTDLSMQTIREILKEF